MAKGKARRAHRRPRRTVVHHRNPRKRRVTARSRRRTLRRNPRLIRAHHRRRRRLRRNPFGSNYRNLGEMSLAAVICGVGARAIPEKVDALSSMNNGITGYALNFISGAALAWLLTKTPLRENGGVGGLVGTIAQVGGRIVSDRWGKTVVTFNLPTGPGAAAVPAQMSGMGAFGDPAFNLGAYVKPYAFPLPNDGRKVAVPAAPSAMVPRGATVKGSRPLSRNRHVM